MSRSIMRKKFLELSEDIFRELGFFPPPMLHEESLPLAMELELDGFNFELLHSSGDLNYQVLIKCKLGKIPQSNEFYGLQMLMRGNLENMRIYAEWYGVDFETREVLLMNGKDLGNTSAQDLVLCMKQMIENSSDWEARFFDPTFLRSEDLVGPIKSILA